VLCDDVVGGDERCAELLENVPALEKLFERKTSEEVQAILDTFLDSDDVEGQIEKFGGNTGTTNNNNSNGKEVDAVEAAFNDLLNN
jgi:hypothetical protein